MILVPLLAVTLLSQPAPPVTTVYRDAQVWTGSGFTRRDLAVRDGRIVPVSRGGGAASIDLAGSFVVPPYANAHCHLTSPDAATNRRFIDAGVFSVWNPNTIVMTPADTAYFGRPDTINVKVSYGGITEPRGHPEPLYVDQLTQWVYKGRKQAWFLGNAFHYGRTPAEIDAALDRLVEQRADFVKTILIHSEEYAQRRDDPKFEGLRGLNPANLPHLVRAAHARRLKVAVHVETSHDLEVAARAGADIAAHLPAYGSSAPGGASVITPSAARAAVRAGMRLVPTYALAPAWIAEAAKSGKPRADADRVLTEQRANLLLLKRLGARFWMGTDTTGPIFDEAEHWVTIGGFTAAEATRVVLQTGAELFPERRTGCLAVGCAADFLVLGGDPTRDIRQLRAITRRVKAGVELAPPAPAPPPA